MSGRHAPPGAGWGMVVAVTLLIVLALVLSSLLDARFQRGQRDITCLSAEANVDQLTALHEIADQLGVPVDFRVPEVPPECRAS